MLHSKEINVKKYFLTDGTEIHPGQPFIVGELEYVAAWHTMIDIEPFISMSIQVQDIPDPPNPEPTPPTTEQIIAAYTAAVQAHLDAFAQTRNYDGILSAATYASSTVPKFQAEGQYAVEARDAIWAMCYAILADVQGGQRAMPSQAELIAELPALVWPT